VTDKIYRCADAANLIVSLDLRAAFGQRFINKQTVSPATRRHNQRL